MTFPSAIRACFAKYVTFSGRASRVEFWFFFPVGVSLPILAASAFLSAGWPLPFASTVFLIAALPLFAAGARRLQDTGEHGVQAVAPWGFAFGAVVCGWVAFRLHTALIVAFSSTTPPDGPGGLGFILIYGGGKWIMLIAAFILGLRFVTGVVPALGQCLIRGEVGRNRFGPAPTKVPT